MANIQSSSLDTTTEIQQDLGADLNLDSFQYISPDKPEIAEATDSSESKGSDEPLAEVNSEAPCNTDLASAIPLSDDCAKTTETDKYISLSHPQVKDNQNTTAIDAQANTRNVVQEEEKYKAQLDNHIGSKTAVFTGFLERKSQQQAATSLAQKQHRQQALRSLESAHQRAASCMDGQDMYDNLPQSFKQQRKRKMSIRRLSDAFTWPKDPSVTEVRTTLALYVLIASTIVSHNISMPFKKAFNQRLSSTSPPGTLKKKNNC
jgi:hypothetical protein